MRIFEVWVKAGNLRWTVGQRQVLVIGCHVRMEGRLLRTRNWFRIRFKPVSVVVVVVVVVVPDWLQAMDIKLYFLVRQGKIS
jgi:hypothetical protein